MSAPVSPALAAAAATSTAWPFEEARKLKARIERTGQSTVVFETGYGPSGLPHLGTFGEVARTSMVRHAFRVLTGDRIPTRLIAFSDDMDGLRKVPDNVPNKAMLAEHLGQPLTAVPDPFGTHDSFGAHNNARLRAFLDAFGFDYTFMSSTEAYRAGTFDAALRLMLERYDAVMAIMLPSFREERAGTYSPFLPLHPETGIVMQVPLIGHDAAAGTIAWADPATGTRYDTPVTGGHCKLQWKPDWAMRWHALGVDYEMAGKDLIDSVKLSGRIVRALGSAPPEGFNYELFLDEKGQKISKSKGNGLTIDEWLTYASPDSLALFMYGKPTAAKRLHFDVIPRAVDDYLAALESYPRQAEKERLGNPVWHIHGGEPPTPERLDAGQGSGTLSFAMLLNLVAVANTEDPAVLWAFLRRYAPAVSPETHPRLDGLVKRAVRYFGDVLRPAKRYREPDAVERDALTRLSAMLEGLPRDASPEEIQTALYDVARPIPRYQDFAAKTATPDRPGVSNDWFNMLYQVLLGEARGPRFGSFVALYGIAETRALIAKALDGRLAAEHAAFLHARRRRRSGEERASSDDRHPLARSSNGAEVPLRPSGEKVADRPDEGSVGRLSSPLSRTFSPQAGRRGEPAGHGRAPVLIYKIIAAAAWQAAEAAGSFAGAAVDHADGFIHFSTANQAPETAARHFAGLPDLMLVSVDADALGPALRWEPSRGGALFPHLYGPLPLSAVRAVRPLPLGPDGRHSFPDRLA